MKETTYCDMQTMTKPPPTHSAPRHKVLKKSFVKPKPPLDPLLQKKMSLTIHEDLALKDVLFAACHKNGLNIQFGKDIDAHLMYVARDKPIYKIIEEVCEMANLRCAFYGRNIKIENDAPYFKNYMINFLKFSRNSENKIASATDVFADDSSAQKSILDNGSNSTITVKSQIDFWKELEETLKLLLHDAKFSMHRQGGIISVLGNSRHHQAIQEYLAQLDYVTSAQVLIEAKVIEVRLNQAFRSGIDWSIFPDGKSSDASISPRSRIESQLFQNLPGNNGQNFAFGSTSYNFDFFLRALETFGSLRVISSPRITVLNNQTAVIKVVENEVFFTINYQTHYLGLVDEPREGERAERFRTYSSSKVRTMPVGFIMPIQVSINRDTGEVTLFTRPTFSRKSGEVADPSIQFNAQQENLKEGEGHKIIDSKVPIVEIREIDSVLKLRDGEIAFMGGLMEARSQDDKATLPGADRVQPIDDVLSARKGTDSVTELVILLKATIVENAACDAADQRLVSTMPDPRPFRTL